MAADLIIHNIKTIYTSNLKPPVRGRQMNDIQELEKAYIAIKSGRIEKVGAGDFSAYVSSETRLFDAGNNICVPGFIDSHTHLVFAGSREEEFAQKLAGVPYLDILAAGGGILSTVEKTRSATLDELYQQAYQSLDEMLLYGVTTIEAKSGYGLDLNTEIKQLEVAKRLNLDHPIDILSTYLGAHALPKEYKDNKQGFIKEIISDMQVIKAKDLAKFVDVFCEKGVFDIADTQQILEAALDLGFVPRIHADEIEPIGGAELGANMHAASVDHLMVITDSEIDVLARTNTIANLLPATSFYLNKPYAPARKLIDANVAVSVSSDYNPGSTPSENFQLTMQLAANKLRMTPKEVLNAVTINPAYSLGIDNDHGSIEVGKVADIVILKSKNLDFLFYHYGINQTLHVFKAGKPVVINRTVVGKENNYETH